MTSPSFPPVGYTAEGPTYFQSPPLAPGINTSTAPTSITTPAIPATTVSAVNTNSVDCIVYITSGGAAVTVIKVNGVTTGLQLLAATTSAVTVYLPAGASISMTYASTAPTWVWLAA